MARVSWPPGVHVVGDSRRPKSWHKARRERLTASQVAAALNLSKWANYDQVLAQKRGEDHWEPSQHAWMGQQKEKMHLDIFGRMAGLRLSHNTQCVENALVPGLACTPDAIVTGDRPLQCPASWLVWHGDRLALSAGSPLDAKNVAAKNDYFWRSGPPAEYELQIQADLLVLGARFGALVVAFDSWRMEAFVVEADLWVHDAIREVTQKLQRDLRAG